MITLKLSITVQIPEDVNIGQLADDLAAWLDARPFSSWQIEADAHQVEIRTK